MNLLSPIHHAMFVRIVLRLARGITMVFLSAVLAFATYTLVNAAPTITATLTDTFIGGDGDGKADPGETIEYTAVITNSGADPATGVTFNDILDINTTLVAGSINVSPLAGDDAYETIGNTLLEVGVTPSGNTAIITSGSIFNNDTEFLGDTFTLKSVEADSSAPFINVVTESSGSVTVNSNGSFTYTPAAGFSGADHFDYVITDDGPDNILGNSDDLTGAGRVTINVSSAKVWYVKNNAAAGGLGRSSDPFDTLLEAQTASAANDTIYVFTGSGTTGQNSGIILKNGQRLIGEGVALTVPVSVNGGPNPTILRPAGTRPTIGNSAGDGVTLSTVNIAGSFSGVEIRGLNISGTGAGTNAVDVTTHSTFSGSFELADNVISAAGGEGVDVNAGGSGSLTVSIHDNNVTATGNGIDIVRTAGNVNITAFDDNVINGLTGGTGINVNGGGSLTFDATPGGTFQTVSGGTTTIGTSGDGVGASGMVLTSVAGDLSFTDLDIVASNGTGLSASGITAYTGSAGFQLAVGAGATVNATSGPAVNLSIVTASLPFLDVDSASSTTTGVSLNSVSGTFSAGTGSNITNAVGTDFVVSNSNATVTYSGSITDSAGAGVSLTSNSGSTITFNGGLSISSGASTAFNATGGGTVNVCDENPCNPAATGTLVNTLTSTTGTALNIDNTTIGSNNLEFRSISANGAANGIVLNVTGNVGGLKVKGDGGSCSSAITCTGGAIQNSTADAVKLTSTRDVVLTHMFLFTSAQSNIDATSVTNLTLSGIYSDLSTAPGVLGNTVTNLTITNSTFDRGGAGSVACNVNGLDFTNLLGTSSVTGSIFKRSNTIQFRVNNNTATAFSGTPDQLTVSGTSWNTHTNACAGDHLSVNADTGANFKLIVDNSSGSNNSFTSAGTGVQATAGGTNGKMMALVSGISDSANTAGVVIGNTGTGSTNIFNISNNTISGTGSLAIAVTHVSSGATTSGTIANNTITHTAGPGTNAVQVILEGGGNLTTTISSNNISGNYQRGLHLQSRLGTGILCANILNNTLTGTDTTGVALQQINIETGGSGTGHGNSICLNMANNNVSLGPGATYTAAYRLFNRSTTNCTLQACSFQLQNFVGNGAVVADIQTWVTTTKSNSGAPVSVTASQAFVASAGNCPLPVAFSPPRRGSNCIGKFT